MRKTVVTVIISLQGVSKTEMLEISFLYTLVSSPPHVQVDHHVQWTYYD